MQFRNPELHEALYALFLLRNSLISEIGDMHSPTSQQKVIHSLERSPELARCADVLKKDGPLWGVFEATIIAPGLGSFDFKEPGAVLNTFLGSGYCSLLSFDEAYGAFESISDTDHLAYSLIAPLDGWWLMDEVHEASSQGPLLKLSNGVQIRRLDKVEQVLAYQFELVRRFAPRSREETYAIALEFSVPRTRISAGGMPNTTDEAQGQNAIVNAIKVVEEALYMLRAFKEGNLYQGGMMLRMRGPVFEGLNRTWLKSLSSPFAIAPNVYILGKLQELDDLKEFIRSAEVASSRGNGHLFTAMRWLSHAGDSERLDDRLIDIMIASEALAQVKGNQKGRPIADIISSFFSDGIQHEVYLDMLNAYQVRNAIIHEGDPSGWFNSNRDKGEDLFSVTFQAESHLRNALKESIFRSAR